MSDPIIVAVIGVVGTLIGSGATLLVAALQARRAAHPATPPGHIIDPTPILGEAIDIRELRVLRALYGEPKGRLLDGYKDAYYKPSLDETLRKGWVQKSGGKFYLTGKGADFCWTYVTQLHAMWRPYTP